ncbi:MAG TPA: preprotein translocase subunit SecY [Phycisphaerae bacterium]|nr:preprotein translocase subunit SecY [Phycisphaerales bacterium]HRX85804.1 preprotein translocase subunit SecY [Phycisphaerae bacterium]
MFASLINIWRVKELRNKILFTLGLLAIYRIGYYVPVPGVAQEKMVAPGGGGGAAGGLADMFALFTGGNLSQSTIFGLGIMPYISASIIFQLLVTVIPALERLQKEGDTGRKKIQEYTRYATVGLCVIQATMWMKVLGGREWVYAEFRDSWFYYLFAVTCLTAGTIFLMWLGEQIDEYGIGNGISLIIMAGIVARMPNAVIEVAHSAVFSLSRNEPGTMGPGKIIFLIVAFFSVVAGSILITQGQRRIPIQQAKQTRGRRVYGGQRSYIPLLVNHGGVMPIIFASTLMMFPGYMFGWLAGLMPQWTIWFSLGEWLRPGGYMYSLAYVGMVYFFAYFWTTVQFQPKEMANNLRDYGSFIPGLRPGKRTADYLEQVMGRITYVGAAFLALIALIPTIVAVWLEIPFSVSAFLGGTGLLIVVSVALDLVQRIEANLIMRNYKGFLGGSSGH